MATRTVSQSINLQSDQTSKYITRISSDGITVHPEIQNSGSNYIHIDSNGLKIKNQEGNAPAISTDTELAGFASDSVRIGNETSGNTLITTDGIQIRDGETTLASFADTLIQIGSETSGNTLITTDGIQIRDGETTLASFASDSIQIGNETSGNTLITTDGMTVRDGTETLASFTKDMVQVGDPSNGGGNLLARSNGVAIRDGLADLASFQKDKFLFYDQNGIPVYSVTNDYVPEVSLADDASFATMIRNNAAGGVHRSLVYSYRNTSDNGMVSILEGREDVVGASPYSAIGLRVYNSEEAAYDEGAVFYLYSGGRFEFRKKAVGSSTWEKTINMTPAGELLYGSDYYIKTVLFTFKWTPESSYVNKEVSVDISSYAGTPISATMEYNSAPTLAFFTPRIYDGKLYVRIMQTTQGSGQKSFRVKVAFRLPK